MSKMTAKQVAEYIHEHHKGQTKAVKAPALAEGLGLPERTLRGLMRDARRDGHPICGDDNGIYYALFSEDALHLYARLMSRSNDLRETADAILAYIKTTHPSFGEQKELPL